MIKKLHSLLSFSKNLRRVSYVLFSKTPNDEHSMFIMPQQILFQSLSYCWFAQNAHTLSC